MIEKLKKAWSLIYKRKEVGYWEQSLIHFIFSHTEYMRPFCIRCGIKRSIQCEQTLKQEYNDMDSYIKSSNKLLIAIKDGHRLPRSVFRGAKCQNLIPQFITITYTSLLKSVVERIKENMETYLDFLEDTIDTALLALDAYSNDKKYTDPSNVIDIVIFALSDETECDIKVHYQGEDKSFDAHVIKPKSPSVGVIELAFIHGHYDLVIKSKNVIKKEGVGGVNIDANVIEADDNRLRIDATCLDKGNCLDSGCNMLNTDGNRLVTDGICLNNDGNELDDDNIWLDTYGNR